MRVRIPRLEQRTGGLAARSVRNPYPPGLLDSARLLLHVTPRRGPELTPVFPVELGNAFVANFDGRAARVFPFDQHEPLGLIKPQTFLELQGLMPVTCLKCLWNVDGAMSVCLASSSIWNGLANFP